MKITEIRVLIEPWIHDTDNYELRVRIYPEFGDHYNIQVVYPLDHLKSVFDMIWEDTGKALKQKLMEEDENG